MARVALALFCTYPSPGGDASSGTDNIGMIDQMLMQVAAANASFNKVPYTDCTLLH